MANPVWYSFGTSGYQYEKLASVSMKDLRARIPEIAEENNPGTVYNNNFDDLGSVVGAKLIRSFVQEMNPDLQFSPKQSQTETPEFKRWFGNSKVVDEGGNPMRVYHATPSDFTQFLPGGVDPKISGHAIWFTDRADYQPAMHRISSRSQDFQSGTNVMPVYLRMQRPLMIDTKEMLDWARDVFANGSMEFPQLMPSSWVKEVTRDGEYDGIIFDGPALGWKDSAREYIVFEPTQIKSAIGNNGQFDPSNPDIRYSPKQSANFPIPPEETKLQRGRSTL